MAISRRATIGESHDGGRRAGVEFGLSLMLIVRDPAARKGLQKESKPQVEA
jgi:hypothetical protein